MYQEQLQGSLEGILEPHDILNNIFLIFSYYFSYKIKIKVNTNFFKMLRNVVQLSTQEVVIIKVYVFSYIVLTH